MRSLFTIPLAFVQLLTCCICHAHQDKIDSLKKVLPTLKDTAREDCLHDLGVQYLLVKSNEDSATYFFNLVYGESKRINYPSGLARACVLRAAIANHFHNDYSQMEKWASEAVCWFERTSNKKLLEIACWQLAYAQCRESKYQEALTNAKRCYY